MSEKRRNSKAPETKREAPKYIVAYSAMMTILLAFFIMLNSLATVQEGGLRFQVTLSDYLDTGLFLDHRITRDMVRSEA